jgi:hypothetical protein
MRGGERHGRAVWLRHATSPATASNIEYAHAGADPRLLKELSRDWLDEAALYSQTLKLII